MCEKCDYFSEVVQDNTNFQRAHLVAGVIFHVMRGSSNAAMLIQMASAMAMLTETKEEDAHDAVHFVFEAWRQAQVVVDEAGMIPEDEKH